MRKLAIPLLVLLIIAGVISSQTFYIVDETQFAIVTRFGEFQESKKSPGLAVKIPFVESVTKLDSRLLRVDAPPASLLTLDKRTLVIDAFARYRITHPLVFFQALRTESNAEARISDIISSSEISPRLVGEGLGVRAVSRRPAERCVKPAAVIVRRSVPLPLTASASTRSPKTSSSASLTEVLPPPGCTRSTSAPIRFER